MHGKECQIAMRECQIRRRETIKSEASYCDIGGPSALGEPINFSGSGISAAESPRMSGATFWVAFEVTKEMGVGQRGEGVQGRQSRLKREALPDCFSGNLVPSRVATPSQVAVTAAVSRVQYPLPQTTLHQFPEEHVSI